MTVISAMAHTHLTGTAVSTRLIRNGTDMGYIFNAPNYDFNYEQAYTLNPYLTITKVYIPYQTQSISFFFISIILLYIKKG